uniref:Ubiquitin-conjugating enzyme E2 Z n=1 Tax=Mimiviridae sp. ChoanoV1 TaxID=2596887 RepID=A0A5B8IFR2_9VIRU|nr:ubiquitin-conjugating enzyme [Mimiviridae sp. ChoanoV1]
MSSLAIKRISADIKNIRRNNLDEQNIYVSVNEENMFKIKAMIIGPKDTPYENGFYFFDFEIPKDYPISPPKAKFVNLNGIVRFHPNLYKCGKICLSILNTWHGPGWTSVQTLSSVLLSIQSLMNEHPIQNEPGWETEIGIKSKEFNNVINYHNINTSVLSVLKKIPYGYEEFKDIVLSYFVKNIEMYNKLIQKQLKMTGQKIKSSIYSMSVENCNYNEIKEEIQLLYSKYDLLYGN